MRHLPRVLGGNWRAYRGVPASTWAESGSFGRFDRSLGVVVSQVERGIRSVDRLSVLLGIARILQVDVESLIGRPWQLAPNGGVVAQGLDAVRQVLTRYGHLLGVEAPSMLPLPEL